MAALKRINIKATRICNKGQAVKSVLIALLLNVGLAHAADMQDAGSSKAPKTVAALWSDFDPQAWGAPIARVEVRIDEGPWRPATIDRSEVSEFAWKTWSLDWDNPSPGEHAVTSRAIDTAGQIQPAMDDPWIANKHTYWESNGQVTRRILII